MEKTNITLEYSEERPAFGRAILPEKKKRRTLPWKQVAAGLGLCGIGFLWGHMELLQILRPMGMAYLSAFFGEGILFWCVYAVAGIGSFGEAPLKTAILLAAAAAVQMTMGRFVEREECGKKALLGAFAAVLSGVFYAFSQGGLGFHFAVTAVEAALVLSVSMLVQKGILVCLERPRDAVLTGQESLSLLFLGGGALAGLSAVEEPFWQQGLLPAAAAFFLLLAARQNGIGGGAVAGVFLGFLLFLNGGAGLPLFAALSLGGMLAGCAGELGRLASALAVVLAPCMFLFYIDVEVLDVMWMGGLVIGAVLFSLFPQSLLEKAAGGFREKESPADRYTKMKELTEEKLVGFSDAFQALAKTFVQEGERKHKGELTKLVDTIAEKVCPGCGLAPYCWESELYQTYSMTFSALSRCEERGNVTLMELPLSFRQNCVKAEQFVQAVNESYEGYRRDCMWSSRLAECRELVGQQLAAVSEIMLTLSGQMELNCIFLEAAEERLLAALEKEGFRPKKLIVTEEKNSKGKQVRLTMGACGGKGVCRDKILPIVRKTLGCPMLLQAEGTCSCDAAEWSCTLHFQEEPAFAMTTAAVFSPAEEGTPVGDAAAFLQTENGSMLLAVSDGMGTGERAAQESHTAIELLEQFTEAGFDRELAVRMINSALLLRRGEEAYATLDICHVDLFDGHAQFIKLGAAASYIRRGSRVISLRSASLPAGILKQVSVEKNDMLLKDGDMLIMVTDGVTDAIGGEEKTAAWLRTRLEAVPMSNPQDVAEYILREAKRLPQERADDMTVLAARFWQKRA